MPVQGSLHHLDLSVGHPERSIRFYAALLEALGFERQELPHPDWQGPAPSRATWALRYSTGASFEVELRPASPKARDRKYDRYAPGPHHLAFHAASRADVDRVHHAMQAVGARVLDPPADYGGHAGYADGYYAVFFADPDEIKLEVVHLPGSNP